MSGVDKFVALSPTVSEYFDELAQEKGVRRGGYSHVVDLRQQVPALPAVLYRGGIHNGWHKLEIVGVARIGRQQTLKIVKAVFGHLSRVKICRIDFCVDLLGVSVWELARICFLGRAQNYHVYRTRKGDTLYLQRSKTRVVEIYDRGKVLRASQDPWAQMLRRNEDLTRVEVQLRGPGVLFRCPRDLDRYAEVNLLPHLRFRRLVSKNNKKPLRSMAAAYLASEVDQFGIHAVLKRFPSAQRAYIQKLFTEDVGDRLLPDIRRKLRHAIRDWLNDRIRFPRFLDGQE